MFDKFKNRIIPDNNDSIEETISTEENGDVICDVEVPEADLSALDYIKNEFRERSIEDKQLQEIIAAERLRLKDEREKAKNRNVFRKIKFVDERISKKEDERDTAAIAELTRREKLRVANARAARSKTMVAKNKKPIAIAIATVFALVSAAGGVASIKHNAEAETLYKQGVQSILDEDYEAAKDALVDINKDDSSALYQYADYQSDISSYKGKPGDMLFDIEDITDLTNEDVKKQYDEACVELGKAEKSQTSIDSLKVSSVDNLPKDEVEKIETDLEKIKQRYKKTIEVRNLDTTKNIINAIEGDTASGKIIKDIEKLGEISLESGESLSELRSRYDKLSQEDKDIVFNYDKLADSEKQYSELKAANDKKIAEEKAKKEAEEKARKEAEEEARRKAEKEEAERKEKEKEEALQAEAEEYAASARDNMTVYVVSSSGTYHISGCRHLNRSKSYWETTYGEAKRANRHACETCYPDTYCERAYNSYVSEYISKHSGD